MKLHITRLGVPAAMLLVAAAVLGGLIWHYPGLLQVGHKIDPQVVVAAVLAALTFGIVLVVVGYSLLGHRVGLSAYERLAGDDASAARPAEIPKSDDEQAAHSQGSMDQQMRNHYGLFWRRKIRLFLVFGEPNHIEAIAPALTTQHWLHSHGKVLLWGGSLLRDPEAPLLKQWRRLTRWRAFDAVVWALDKAHTTQPGAMEQGVRSLQGLARQLRWHLPLQLWEVCHSDWPQPGREAVPVGCLLPSPLSEAALEKELQSLIPRLSYAGMQQIRKSMANDFLLRLSWTLKTEGIARWCRALSPLAGEFRFGVPLRGLWFSLPEPARSGGLGHDWPTSLPWQKLLKLRSRRRRLGWSGPRLVSAAVLGLAVVWTAGMLLSYTTQQMQFRELHATLAVLEQGLQGDDPMLAFSELTVEVSRLAYRAEHGAPWYQRFGLNRNQALLDALWSRYLAANNRLLRDPAAAQFAARLRALVALPPGSPARSQLAPQAYLALKAYLMMAQPEKADAAFLSQALAQENPAPEGVSPGLWLARGPMLQRFYAEHLRTHPDWRIEPDTTLIAHARQALLSELGQRNTETSLYQQVLAKAAQGAPDLGLRDMVGDTDAGALFSTGKHVPGLFTRQAWEGQVRQAIDAVAEARREQVDWVLSDQPAAAASSLSPAALKQRLTARYFDDYATAWLGFLNSLRWQKAAGLNEVVEQLTLMSDPRQSPLVALLDTLAYQGAAGGVPASTANGLVASAQKLIGRPVPGELASSNPLQATFGPLLALQGQGEETPDRLSLHTYLTRVTRVRLLLQQVSHASDPQALTLALAQTVFQGKGVDLSETQAYGKLIAASLGAQWAGAGRALFVQPLEQAWQQVLQPSAAALERQWQRAIVTPWDEAFTGRYPFAGTAGDASLPMLGQMIRAGSGRIEQFVQQELGGMLRKEGGHWVPDPRHSHGLRFDPVFLQALDQLSELADVLYTDGGMGLGFELRGKGVQDLVQTTFTLDGARHHYFNQKERWQRFTWPGQGAHPGARLTWTSVWDPERTFGDYEGNWGLIRLLEQAQVTPLDDGGTRYKLVITAPDGLGMTWHLRTELHGGPLALLKLRGFRLPQRIFLGAGEKVVAAIDRGEP